MAKPYCNHDECHHEFPHGHGVDDFTVAEPQRDDMPCEQYERGEVHPGHGWGVFGVVEHACPGIEPTKQREGDQDLPEGGILCVQDLVIAAMEESKRVGKERYGSPLMTFNGRKGIQDVVEEARDFFVYATQIQAEADAARDTLVHVMTEALDDLYRKKSDIGEAAIHQWIDAFAIKGVDAIMGWVVGQITNAGWDEKSLHSDIMDFLHGAAHQGFTWLQIADGLTEAILAGPKEQS